uniref:Uncharacterized protein n=1 Tax=Panagrolaimus sp. PS1159 TaxID=55785 RepID=A0AC35GBE7_9BILA
MDSLAHDSQPSLPIENPIIEEGILLLLHFESQDINDYEMIKTALAHVNGKEISKYIFKFDSRNFMYNARASMRRSNEGLLYLFDAQPTIRTTVLSPFVANMCGMDEYQFFEI